MPDSAVLSRSSDRLTRKRATRKRPNHQLRWGRTLFWLVIALSVLVLFAAVAGVLWLRSVTQAALPMLDGDLHLAGLSATVTIRRDAHGVPHIEAAKEDDLFVAQGYITAQDRLWQMDAMRRNASGELAEILGASMLQHDKEQRVLRLRVTAQRIYDHLQTPDRARFEDYARGVNLFLAQHSTALPPEFRLLCYRPRPWSGVDSVMIGLTMAQTLDTHWKAKLVRERIAAKLGNSRLESDLYPVGSWRDHPPTGILLDLSQPHPEPPPATDDDEEDDDRSQASTAPETAALPTLRSFFDSSSCTDCAPGSNNWVIAGSHTASGKPLLSNDMHLALTAPDLWYMADLQAPGYHATGVTLPGVPFVIAGHNEHVAWGFTALYADVQDLYVEKLDGKGNYQATDGTWKPLAVDHEIIQVRGGNNVTLEVQSTAHGPLLNPILDHESRPIALQWTLYDPSLAALPIYQLNVASNWTEFSQALGNWCWPMQNLVYSDDQGHIAYHAIGRLPLRPAGLKGVPIQDADHQWQGYLPFDQMPNSVDPPSGFLATANSRVTTANAPNPLTLEWVDPYRVERIYKLLEGRNQLTAAEMLAVEDDIYSEVDQELGHRLAYAIDHTAGTDERLRKAADLMRSWDGRLTADSAAASLVTQTRKTLWPLLLEPKLGKLATEYRWSESNFAEEEIVMHASANWLPASYKSWDALLTDAVRKGMEAGKVPTNVALWSYGSWHVVEIEHPLAKYLPIQYLPILGRIVGTGAQPLSGDTTTVKQASRAFGPSQRFTMDWSNIDGSTENITLGESGNPLSPYFRDQWQDYYRGSSFALPFSATAVNAQASHTLRLLP